jgi:hypothetical protein
LSTKKYRLALYLALAAATTTNAAEIDPSKVVPLKKYIETHSLDDPPAAAYVHSRCIGLFLAFAIASKNQKGAESEKFHSNARSAYQDLTKSLALLTIKSSKNPDAAMKEHTEANIRLQKMYTAVMDTALDQGREVSESQPIDGDLPVCAAIVRQLRSK